MMNTPERVARIKNGTKKSTGSVHTKYNRPNANIPPSHRSQENHLNRRNQTAIVSAQLTTKTLGLLPSNSSAPVPAASQAQQPMLLMRSGVSFSPGSFGWPSEVVFISAPFPLPHFAPSSPRSIALKRRRPRWVISYPCSLCFPLKVSNSGCFVFMSIRYSRSSNPSSQRCA